MTASTEIAKCPRANSWFRSCQFEARFDLGVSEYPGGTYEGGGLATVLEKFRKKTYVRDVCIRCGKTIERSADLPPFPFTKASA